MTKATSLWLDVVRLAAAMVVFAAHTACFWNPAMMGAMQGWAHHAVIIFFVLSGYVIAHSVESRPASLGDFAVARLSRLYSVVVPALILTAVLWWIGRQLDPEVYAGYERRGPFWRFLACGCFMNEAWFWVGDPPANPPFWSLGYEFWYYVFFGIWTYVGGLRKRWLWLLIAMAIAGPKVLALLPTWLVGVWAYKWRERVKISRVWAGAGFVFSLCAAIGAMKFMPSWPMMPGSAPWYYSGAAISDWVVGLTWGSCIWCCNQMTVGQGVPVKLYGVVRWLAGHTFSLYLFHAPLVIFALALVPMAYHDRWLVGGIMGTLLLLVFGLGAVAEGQRFRWHRGLAWFWDRSFGRIAQLKRSTRG